MTNLRMILAAAFVAVFLGFGYLSYNFYGKLQISEQRNADLIAQLAEKQKSLDDLYAEQAIVSKVAASAASDVQGMSNTLVDIIGKINVVENTVKETADDISKGTGSVATSSDAELQRLLNAAYCASDPKSAYCNTGGNAPKKASN